MVADIPQVVQNLYVKLLEFDQNFENFEQTENTKCVLIKN